MADELNTQEAGDDTYREEVESALSEDETRLGDVWRLSREDLEPKEIAGIFLRCNRLAASG